MQLTDIFLRLGTEHFEQLLRTVSIGRLKTYKLYERMKLRLHLNKLNSETLRHSAPRLWKRFEEQDETLATELSQCILISHMEMIKAALDHLGIEHEDGFFSKDAEVAGHLTEGWQAKTWEALKGTHSPSALLFYINHLGFEAGNSTEVFLPAA